MRLALYEPDIPQNAGAMMRLAACLGVAMDIIEPCGFVLSDRHLKRAGMDYLALLDLATHRSWTDYVEARRADPGAGRLILLSTGGHVAYTKFAFDAGDTIIMGRESAGVPPNVHDTVDAVLVVPLVAAARSLNVVTAAAMVLGEALRQTRDASPKTLAAAELLRRK
ncbi:MAG: tRNA (cytidine(34)-2'-O)-methyltransferase [Alphaproteobacteria bacterium]|nr:tRNA (cytidine(34)-2'-O)-methyltransferase [Alphaproteobacteria bacterium]MCZ6765143.1 tRNA (cytidine(34)-2'-O)-methyltransferase [Alphaproteobacteria bacterium]